MLPASIKVSNEAEGAGRPLAHYVVLYADGTTAQWQRAPKAGETTSQGRIVAYARYDSMSDERSETVKFAQTP